jgi:hypothetical protein
MRLVDKIGHLLRAGLSPRSDASVSGKRRPRQLQPESERIKKGLEKAAAQEKTLEEQLARTLEEGRERDAIRIRRQLAEIRESSESLRTSLDLAQAWSETKADHSVPQMEELEPGEKKTDRQNTLENNRSHEDLEDGSQKSDQGLEARKARLARKSPPPSP